MNNHHAQAMSKQVKIDISHLLHEASQPLMIINTYVSACMCLLSKHPLDASKLLSIMDKINNHLHNVNQGIQDIRNYVEEN